MQRKESLWENDKMLRIPRKKESQKAVEIINWQL
jgi:hypothetical protein